MSIYATILFFDEDEDDEDGEGAPYRYIGSNVVPSLAGERAGWLEIACIFEDVEDVGDAARQFLRMHVCGGGDEQQSVLLDRKQVTAMVNALNRWLISD